MALKNIVYLSTEDYTTLKENGTTTIGEQTITYSEDDIYLTPDNTAEQMAALQKEIATHDSKITSIQSAVGNLVLDGVFPVDSRYFQFPDSPEPAELFGGTWVVDEDAMDKFLVGAGNLYELGSTGGSADAVVVKHSHNMSTTYSQDNGGNPTPSAESTSVQAVNSWLAASTKTVETGEDGTGKNLPPYLAVTIWKRTA